MGKYLDNTFSQSIKVQIKPNLTLDLKDESLSGEATISSQITSGKVGLLLDEINIKNNLNTFYLKSFKIQGIYL